MEKLFLVTEGFPYGTGEKPFIMAELPELLKHYDVTIVSHTTKTVMNDKEKTTILPPEVKVVNIDIQLPWYRRIKYLVKYFFDRDGFRETNEILKEKKNILQRLYQSIGFYGLAMENNRLMKKKKILSPNEKAIYYTYWYFYYTYSMTKNRGKYPNIKLVTRTHGFDLYDERYRGGRQPFKRIMDKNVDAVFFISEQGRQYYMNKHHDLTEAKSIVDKYKVSRLGTVSTGHIPDINSRKNGSFCLVSCSTVISLKRVNLIAEALSELTEEVEWIHFGGGDEFERLSEQAERLLGSKGNISYQLRGMVPNGDVLDYYSANYVDCFISTSSSEGIPVSIQEAMSFGIPIIATAVGGVPECFEDNGILMSANPSREEIVSAIREMIHMDRREYEMFRGKSLKIWAQKYNAEVNRKKFVEMLKEA